MMTYRFRCISLFALLAFSGTIASAQVQTGTPPMGSLGGGPADVINLANLNSHLTIPVIHKPGRGTNFDYDLTYDSAVWYPVTVGSTTSWQNVRSWGWASNSAFNSGNSGYLTYNYSVLYDYAPPDPDPVCTEEYWGNTVYYDQWGTAHKFDGSVTNHSGRACSLYLNTYPGRAWDNSGLTVDTYAGPVKTSGGEVFYPPVNPTGGSYNTTVTDRNGNQMTANTGGTFTDTLGQTALTVSGSAPNPVNFTYTAPSGLAASVRMNYTQYTVRTWFQVPGIADYGATSVSLVSSIVLPDNSQYSFTYEPTPAGASCTPLAGTTACVTARIASVTLPTGGQITYSYSVGYNGILTDGSAATLTRTTPDGAWTYAQVKGTSAASTTTITDPQNNQTVIQFQGIYETQRQAYQGSTSGTLLRTVNTCYNYDPAPCTATAIALPIRHRDVDTVLPNAQLAHHAEVFDTTYGLLKQIDDYDYGAAPNGPLLKRTIISYATLGNGIVDMPQTVAIQDGAAATKAQTTYVYDEGTIAATTGTPQLVGITGSRGNVTTIKSYKDATTFLTKSFTYFDTGNVQTATDVNGAVATYVYADATSTCGNSFPSSVNEPLSLSRSMTWNCGGGVQLTSTDENSKTTTTAYTDASFWRPASVTDPLNNQTNFAYQPNPTYCCPTMVGWTLTFNGGTSVANDIQYKDGLGRTYVDQRAQRPASTILDSVSYTYDANGRLYSVSTPCAISYAGTCSTPKTTQTYDALNRPLQTTDGGGGTTTYSYNQNDVLVTIGPAPAGGNTKRRQLEYDSLGRLTSVCENTAGPGYPGGTCAQSTPQTGYWTKYSYDALGNLTGVTQNAQAAPAQQQTRAYNYDWLSRLTSETVPELGVNGNGIVNYTYDTDASCGTSSGDRVKRLDVAGNLTCYSYDALHRVLAIVTPSGPHVPNTFGHKYFVYDSATVNGVVMTNAKTRLAEAYTAVCPTCAKLTDVGFSYTARGEASDVYQSTQNSAGYYRVSQSYWANGASYQLSSNIATLPMFTNGVDAEGRPNSTTAASGQNPVTGTLYNVFSQPTQVTFGSSDLDAFGYDPNTGRMTQYQFSIGATPQSVTGTLTWNANSTLQQLAITDPFNAPNNQICTYVYDDLARIYTANCGGAASQTFTYDPFGNINKAGSPYSFNAAYSFSSNHITSVSSFTPTYDGNGNVTNDGLHTYTWDVEARPVVMDGISVTYDALNRMVEQNRSGVYTSIVYSPTGQKLALMNAQTLQKAFIPLPGGAAAVYTSAGLDHYRHPDWLGSARLTSSPTRTVLSSVAYAPFGEPYAQFGPADLSFTGQNQDTTGGAYDFLAREYGIQGRWPSPDPIGLAATDLSDPQSLNLYAYVSNDPLGLIDPLGLFTRPDPPPGGGGPDPGPPGGPCITPSWRQTFCDPCNPRSIYGRQECPCHPSNVNRPSWCGGPTPPAPTPPTPTPDPPSNTEDGPPKNRLHVYIRATRRVERWHSGGHPPAM